MSLKFSICFPLQNQSTFKFVHSPLFLKPGHFFFLLTQPSPFNLPSPLPRHCIDLLTNFLSPALLHFHPFSTAQPGNISKTSVLSLPCLQSLCGLVLREDFKLLQMIHKALYSLPSQFYFSLLSPLPA